MKREGNAAGHLPSGRRLRQESSQDKPMARGEDNGAVLRMLDNNRTWQKNVQLMRGTASTPETSSRILAVISVLQKASAPAACSAGCCTEGRLHRRARTTEEAVAARVAGSGEKAKKHPGVSRSALLRKGASREREATLWRAQCYAERRAMATSYCCGMESARRYWRVPPRFVVTPLGSPCACVLMRPATMPLSS